MFFSTCWQPLNFRSPLSRILFAASLLGVSFFVALGQGAVDYTGTGGRHTIKGQIYFPSGRRADAPGLKVKLESMTSNNLSVFVDSTGSFTFKNLTSGAYTIVIEGTNDYDTVREPVYIDDPGSSSMRARTAAGSTPRIFTVPIYLLPKRTAERKAGILNAALATAPKAAADLYLKALESGAAGKNEKAIEQLRSAISLYAQFPLALNELGVQYLRIGHPDKAADALAEAVRIIPEEFQPRLNYGIALLNQRKFALAEEQLRIALQKNDAVPTAHMYLGITLLSMRKLDDAEKELLIAVGSNSSEVANAHRYLGGIYWAKKDYKRAADELETYLKLSPTAADAERTRSAISELRRKQ
jgi:tetratricopeptide (TPR) repeat protein